MTKTVFNNPMVAHVWAQQNQDNGRSNNGQFYFRGRTIYSYRDSWPLASFVAMADGSRAVLLNNRTYSISTTRHMSLTRRALPSDIPVFRVYSPTFTFSGNWDEFKRDFDIALTDAGVTKHHKRRDNKIAEARGIADAANAYAEAFGQPERLELSEDWQAAYAKIIEAEKARVAKVKAEQKVYWLEQAKAWAAGRLTMRGWNAHAEKLITPEQREQREAIENIAADIWKAGGDKFADGQTIRYAMPDRTLLRAVKLSTYDDATGFTDAPAQEIETSRGARFPVEHAVRAFRYLMRMKDADMLPYSRTASPDGEAYDTQTYNGGLAPFKPITLRLGHFTVDKVDAEGTVTAGCHTVEWREVEDMARRLGLIGGQPDMILADGTQIDFKTVLRNTEAEA